MLKKVKRILTGVIASAMVLSSVGCGFGKSTAYALTVDGYQVKAGVYIYYSYTALQEAKNLAKKSNEELDVEDEKALENVQIEGKSFTQWVEDKATSSCAEHVAVIKKFDEMKLSLDAKDVDSINSYAENTYDENPETYKDNGIGEESLKEIMTNTYKSQEIFNALYGNDGTEGVKESDVKDFYVENNARVKYIGLDLHDAEGNDLDATSKKEITDMANDFLSRAKNAASEQDMLDEFDTMQDEYDKYVSDKAAEASGTPVTTAAVTTVTTTVTTTVATTVAQTAADDENADNSATTVVSDASSDGAVTTVAAAEDAETTTTTLPYGNETIIPVVTTDENTKEDDITYTPSKTFYDWVYNTAKTGTPEIIEDEDTMYVAVRLDIKERLTDDDLWSESGIESTRFSMFSDDLQDKIDSWVASYTIDKNEKAYKRYNPFDVKTDSE
jgi:hypothetical protein